MKRIFVALFLVVCSAFAAGQTAGWTNVTASHIYGGSTALGPQLLPAGTISFQPTDNTGKFIAVAINGGAEEVNYPITCQITNGVIQSGCYVPDISLTNPIDICELVTVKNQSGTVILGGSPKSGYQCAQPEGSSWSFDTFVPYVPGWPLLSTPIARIGLVGLVQAPNCLTLGAGYVPQSLNTDGTWNCVNTSGGGGSGVTSWNGRTGAVVPLTGDYSVGQVTNALSNQLNSAEIYVGNSSNIAYPVSMTGDCSISPSGQVTCLKSNGRTFGAAAFLGASGNGPDAATTSVSNDTSGQSACWDGSHNVTNIGCTGGSDTGVSSFNGRTGAVYPATGDYTYAEISGTPALGTAATANLSGSASEAASTSVSNDTAGQTTCWDGNHNVTNQGCSNGLVISFNGRVGAVVPANGDYTYSQISGTPMLGAAAALGVTGTGTKAVTSNGLSGASGSGVCQDGSGNLTGSGCTSGTVTSWNGRTGAVVPATNDYSFSQISGSLLHGQLPALLATDIPNNYANTTGTAGGLSNNITESQVTNLVSDLANRAVLNGANTFTGDQTAPGFCIGSSCVTSWPSYTLPPPTLSSLGGVLAKDCSTFGANYVLQKINADGSETCVLGGGGGGSYPDITDTPSVSVTIAVPTFVDGVIASTESGGAKGIGGTFGPAPAGMSGATNDLIACGSGIWNIWGSNTGNVIDLCFNSSTVYTIAPLQSPAFTGAPTAPTQTTSDTSTDIATDAFVHNVVSAGGGMVYPSAGVANSTGSAWGTSYQVGTSANDLVQLNGSSQLPAVSGTNLTGLAVAQVSGAAPLASPALTGTPTVPTASPGTNTTQAASTAFVQAAVTAGSGIPSTTNVIKGNGSGAALASSIIDSGTTPTQTPNGSDTGIKGNSRSIPNSSAGTTLYYTVCRDSSANAVECAANTKNGMEGVATTGVGTAPGTTGMVSVCWTSGCTGTFSNQTTIGHWAISSATTGLLSDSGSTTQPNQQSWYITSANSYPGSPNATFDVTSGNVNSGGTGGNPPGNVFGPASATSGDGACFNGTTGKVIKDCGYNALEKPIMSAWNSLSSAAAQYFSSGYGGTIPANWSGTTAGTSVLKCKTLPSGTITWTVKDETASTTLGTFAITSGGTVTLATTGGSTATVTAGNVVSVTPSGTDSSAIGCVFTGYFTVTGP